MSLPAWLAGFRMTSTVITEHLLNGVVKQNQLAQNSLATLYVRTCVLRSNYFAARNDVGAGATGYLSSAHEKF